MTVSTLIERLQRLGVPADMEVILRCEPEEDMGPCFAVGDVSLQQSHVDETVSVVIDGVQE